MRTGGELGKEDQFAPAAGGLPGEVPVHLEVMLEVVLQCVHLDGRDMEGFHVERVRGRIVDVSNPENPKWA